MSTAYRINPGKTVEQRHIDRVMSLSCAACFRRGQMTPAVEFHHIRTGIGGGERSSPFLGIGLCWADHQGKTGLHGAGTKGFALIGGFGELDLLADTFMRLTLKYEGERLGVSHV